MKVVRVTNISKRFPGGTLALDQVSMEMRRDDFIIILGPSGAGKSTLIRSINRLVTPTSGDIFVENQNITHLYGRKLTEVRKNIGMIFQAFNLIERLNVISNVLIGGLKYHSNLFQYILGLFHQFNMKEKLLAFECLKTIGIENLSYQRVDTLSGGQKQRVAIARALMQNPSVILADEPIASLDPKSSKLVMDHLLDIHTKKGIPMIINLHQAEFALEYAKRIIGMNNGKIVFDGTPDELSKSKLELIYKENG